MPWKAQLQAHSKGPCCSIFSQNTQFPSQWMQKAHGDQKLPYGIPYGTIMTSDKRLWSNVMLVVSLGTCTASATFKPFVDDARI